MPTLFLKIMKFWLFYRFVCTKFFKCFSPGIEAIANDLNTGDKVEPWNPKTDIRKFTTNAFGKIDFVNEGLGGRKPAKVSCKGLSIS